MSLLEENNLQTKITKNKNRVKGLVGKDDRLYTAIFKATQSKFRPAKPKHEQTVIQYSWEHQAAGSIFQIIFSRPLSAKEIVSFKVCVLVIKLLRVGHHNVYKDAYLRLSMFQAMRGAYNGSPTVYGHITYFYYTYVINKINFHHAFPEIDGTFTIDKSMTAINEYASTQKIKFLDSLLKMMKSLLGLVKRLLSDKSYDECKFSGVVPCVDESWNLYQLILHLLQNFIENDELVNEFHDKLESFIAKFYDYYPQIRQFYSVCNNIFYIKSNVIQLPSLPEDPPVLTLRAINKGETNPKPMPEKKVKKKKKNKNDNHGQIFTFGITNPPPQSFPIELPPVVVPDFNSEDFFTELLRSYTTTSNNNNNNTKTTEYVIKPSTENLDKLRERIRELEALIKKIKAKIKDLEGQNRELELLLRDKEGGLNQVQENMRLRLETQKQEYFDTNQLLKDDIDRLMENYEKEKSLLLLEQLTSAKKSVDNSVVRFNNPNYKGNSSVTKKEIFNTAETLIDALKKMCVSFRDGDNIIKTSRDLSQWVDLFMNDIKGACTIINDKNINSQLGDGSKNVSQTISNLFGDAIKNNCKITTEQLTRDFTTVNNLINGIRNIVTSNENKLMDNRTDIDELAQQELLNLQKIIDENTEKLKLKQESLGEGDEVSVAIMQAAIAITQATQILMQSTNDFQQDRINKSKQLHKDPNNIYRRDPDWTDKLVQAARELAQAVQALVMAATGLSEGKINDMELIQCAKAVAAATANLVAACRAKSDNSQNQQKLDKAANAVIRATSALIDAARSLANRDRFDLINKAEIEAQKLREELELQAMAIKLKKK